MDEFSSAQTHTHTLSAQSAGFVEYTNCTAAYLWESLNKFPDFFRMGTFIDSAHMKL